MAFNQMLMERLLQAMMQQRQGLGGQAGGSAWLNNIRQQGTNNLADSDPMGLRQPAIGPGLLTGRNALAANPVTNTGHPLEGPQPPSSRLYREMKAKEGGTKAPGGKIGRNDPRTVIHN